MTTPINTSWRFIDSGLLSGFENMAIDEALLTCFDPDSSAPLLRLYGWSPSAFSCGRFQNPAEIIALDRCRADGVQVVRRITGGGVIYHTAELTYSLVCPTHLIPGGSSVKDAFFFLTSFLPAFYKMLGLNACYASEYYPNHGKLGVRTPLCFTGTEACDILVNGRKIGGNAQRRLKKVVFQHGSIPLQQMAEGGNQYLLYPDFEVADKTTALGCHGVLHGRESLVAILRTAFEQSLSARLSPAELSENERETAAEYMLKFE